MIKKGTKVRTMFRNDWYNIPEGAEGKAEGPPDNRNMVTVKFKNRTCEFHKNHLIEI